VTFLLEEFKETMKEWREVIPMLPEAICKMENPEKTINSVNFTLNYISSDPTALKHAMEVKKSISASSRDSSKDFVKWMEDLSDHTEEVLSSPSGATSAASLYVYDVDVEKLTSFPPELSPRAEGNKNDLIDSGEKLTMELERNGATFETIEEKKVHIKMRFNELKILGKKTRKDNVKDIESDDILAALFYTMEKPVLFYRTVNELLRNSVSPDPYTRQNAKEQLTQKWKYFIYYTQKAIISLPGPTSETILYRGQSFIPEDIGTWRKGTVIVWPAFSSCTANEAIAMKFANREKTGGVLFEIIVQVNQGCYLTDYSDYPNEQEVLLPTFCKFEVNSVIRNFNEAKYKVSLRCTYINEEIYKPKSTSVSQPRAERAPRSINSPSITDYSNWAFENRLDKLIENEEDVKLHINEEVGGKSFLYSSARQGHTEVVLWLLERGANPFRLCGNKSSPLHAVSFFNRAQTLTCMLNYLKERFEEDLITYHIKNFRNLHNKTPFEEASNTGTRVVFQEFGYT